MKKILILLLLCGNCHAQELDSLRFLNNIKEKIFKVEGHDDIYYDLNRKSLTQTSSVSNNHVDEQFVGFNYQMYNGSFLNKYDKEYLFVISLDSNSFTSFFGHVENYGNTTLIYVFDSSYNQISNVFFAWEAIKTMS